MVLAVHNDRGMSQLRFREIQRFRQPWVWCLLLVTNFWLIGIFGYGLVQQLIKGEQWGSNPMSDMGLVVTTVLMVVFSLGMLWLFLTMSLQVEVRSDALYVHFKYWKRQTIQYGDIASVEACQYRPILQYGGWGIRRRRNGWAFNVSGNKGVRLTFHEGKHLMIGSQRYTELAAAIEAERAR